MDRALALAAQAAALGEVPVGAVVTRGGKVIAEAHNGPREHHDPTAHAEILAIRRAAETLGDERLTDCELWVTLEPCAMCAGAIVHARIGKLYYAASDPKGGAVEHGARGGDELNRPESGANHGWPIISYGIDYSGRPIGEGLTQQEGMAQPVYYWDPVIAPSGMATYTGELFDDWRGDLLIGGLQAEAVVRLKVKEGRVYTEEWIPMGVRVRSLAIANDGAVLVGTDAGEIVALRPE